MIDSQPENNFFPLEHLSVLEVSGEDATKFLQGQLTCDIHEVTTTKASFGAFCNAKGRVISTVLILKQQTDFQIILPSSLIDTLINKLQRYILRSKVTLHNRSQEMQLIGMSCSNFSADSGLADDYLAISQTPFPTLRLPSTTPRFLCLVPEASSPLFISSLQQRDFSPSDTAHWRYLDISCAIPWFELAKSEMYTPQMLNIDKLGGISFSKGCYTGQEIIARTHYLGQNKRELHLVEAAVSLADDVEQLDIFDAATNEKVGAVLAKQNFKGKSRLLLVLQTVDAQVKNFILGNADRTVLTPLLCQ